MAKQIIRGRNVSCRDCVYVRNPRFPLHVEDSVLRSRPSESYRVTCCRRAPPVTFDWTHVDIDPFCGEFDDGTEGICNAPVEKRCGTCANLDRDGEVYDLSLSKEMQMAERRALHFPPDPKPVKVGYATPTRYAVLHPKRIVNE